MARGQCLALVQRLGRDLAGVVDAHQASGQFALTGAQFGFWLGSGRVRARGFRCRPKGGAQGLIESLYQAIEW